VRRDYANASRTSTQLTFFLCDQPRMISALASLDQDQELAGVGGLAGYVEVIVAIKAQQ
jgi:hypothetical protein